MNKTSRRSSDRPDVWLIDLFYEHDEYIILYTIFYLSNKIVLISMDQRLWDEHTIISTTERLQMTR